MAALSDAAAPDPTSSLPRLAALLPSPSTPQPKGQPPGKALRKQTERHAAQVNKAWLFTRFLQVVWAKKTASQ